MNGGAIRATLIFLLNNISKMPNPTLVMRETRLLRPSRKNLARIVLGTGPQHDGTMRDL